MARITILPDRPAGIRRLLAWNARRQYGFLPGVFRVLGVTLKIGMAAGKLYNTPHQPVHHGRVHFTMEPCEGGGISQMEVFVELPRRHTGLQVHPKNPKDPR